MVGEQETKNWERMKVRAVPHPCWYAERRVGAPLDSSVTTPKNLVSFKDSHKHAVIMHKD